VPGQLRDEQVGIYRELEQKVGVARGLANKLRADTWKPTISKGDRLRMQTRQESGKD
jgi:hypothetical protein